MQTETSQATHTSDIENDDAQKPKNYVELQEVERKVEAPILPKKVRFETCDITNEQVETSNNHNYVEDCDASHNADHQQPVKSIKSTKSKAGSAQRRVSMMFFFILLLSTRCRSHLRLSYSFYCIHVKTLHFTP